MKKKIICGVMVLMIILSTPNVKAVSKNTIKKYAKTQMIKKYGWGDSEYNALVKIVNHESSWNYKAVNKKSKAFGLCQALPAKKMSVIAKDYRTNYKTQVRWCLLYIKQRYKTPIIAWDFWKKHHWF